MQESDGSVTQRLTIRRDVRMRMDVYLHRRLKGVSRSRIQKLIQLGAVTLNGEASKAGMNVRRGDVIQVSLPGVAVREIRPEPIPLEVIYEDEWFLVINKQAGLIVHPARSHLSGTMLNGLAYRFQQRGLQAGQPLLPKRTRGFQPADQPRVASSTVDPDRRQTGPEQTTGLSSVGLSEFRPGIVHRLDKNTTGVIVVAKEDQAHWNLARQFEQRTTLKAYLAVVHGNFDSVGGVVEAPIGKHPTIHEAYSVRHDRCGKPSVTIYRVREQYEGYSLVELELKTGRTHQIRVHLSYIGHPIVGDIVYGGEPLGHRELTAPPIAAGSRRYVNFAREKTLGQQILASAANRTDLILAHPALHAALLGLTHPGTGQARRFTAPLHEPMNQLVRLLRQRPVAGPMCSEGYWVDLEAATSSEATT